MIALATEIANGMVFANGSRSHMSESLTLLSYKQKSCPEFFIGNMIPTCIYEDEAIAAEVNRKTLVNYAKLKNYRNYWKEAGYEEEMVAVEKVIRSDGDPKKIAACLSERWLADCTLYGSASKVLDGLESWYAAGVKTPILVPSSAQGNQFKAIEELFKLCTRLR